MKRMFSKYDGAIVKPENFDKEVKNICSRISTIINMKDYANILGYISSIENITELKDSDGKNLLMCACDTNNLSLIKYLLKRGIDINSIDDENDNVLYYLYYAEDNSLEIFQFLVENGINVFNKNKKGEDIFKFLLFINSITPYEGIGKIIQYLLNWYRLNYVTNNFISDPNFVENSKCLLLFQNDIIESLLEYINEYILKVLNKIKEDIITLNKKFTKKDIPSLKTYLENNNIIKVLKYGMNSELTNKLIENLIINERDDFKKKFNNALVLCNTLLKIAGDKEKAISMLLKKKKSDIAAASLLRDYKIEELKKAEEDEKKRIKKDKEKEKKKIRKIVKLEKESIPRELELMGEEDKDIISRSEKMSYILAEKKIAEIISELSEIKNLNKMNKNTRNKIERIINRRERERKEREKFMNMIIYLEEEDYNEGEEILKEELRRKLEQDDEILEILEEIYRKQTLVLDMKSFFKL